MLEIDGLRKAFGAVVATDNVSLTVRPGELHALIGPNGAGKSTLITQICGELAPNAGRIVFAGRDITALPAYARARLGLGRSFQLTQLCPELPQPLGRLGLQPLSTPSLLRRQTRGGCQTPRSFHHLQLHRHFPPCRPSRLRDGNGTLQGLQTAAKSLPGSERPLGAAIVARGRRHMTSRYSVPHRARRTPLSLEHRRRPQRYGAPYRAGGDGGTSQGRRWSAALPGTAAAGRHTGVWGPPKGAAGSQWIPTWPPEQ